MALSENSVPSKACCIRGYDSRYVSEVCFGGMFRGMFRPPFPKSWVWFVVWFAGMIRYIIELLTSRCFLIRNARSSTGHPDQKVRSLASTVANLCKPFWSRFKFHLSDSWYSCIFLVLSSLLVVSWFLFFHHNFEHLSHLNSFWPFKLRLFWICGASPSIKYAMMTVKKGADAWTTSKHVKLTRIPATSRSLVEYYMIILIYSGIFGSGHPGILYAMGPFGTV